MVGKLCKFPKIQGRELRRGIKKINTSREIFKFIIDVAKSTADKVKIIIKSRLYC